MLKVGVIVKNDSLEQTAIATLKDLLEKIPFLQIERVEWPRQINKPDYRVSVRFQDHTRLLMVEVKNNGQPRIARLAAYELKDQISKEENAYGIFVAPYISPEAGKICEEAGIGYMDLAGNCLISFETVYIRQTGTPNPNILKRDLRSLYSPKAERILRVLLCEPKNVWKLTELSRAVDVSLGQVANVKKLMVDREWLNVSASGVQLINPSDLLDEWGSAYNISRNRVREYYVMAELPEIEAQFADTCKRLSLQYALTGFSSAARIAPMVRYQKASLYIKEYTNSVIEALGWKAVTSGANVTLLTPYDDGVFYDARIIDDISIVSPLQTYLDLQNIRGRGQEAAQAVRKEMEKIW